MNQHQKILVHPRKVVIFLPIVDFLCRLPISDHVCLVVLIDRLIVHTKFAILSDNRMQKILTDCDYLVKGLFRFTVSYVR